MPWLTGEASQVYADWSSSPVCWENVNAVPLKTLSTSSNPLVRTSGLDSEGSSENVCSAVFHALQPPTSEEFGRKRNPSTSGEESSHHTLPSHCSTPPSAVSLHLPGSCSPNKDAQEKGTGAQWQFTVTVRPWPLGVKYQGSDANTKVVCSWSQHWLQCVCG